MTASTSTLQNKGDLLALFLGDGPLRAAHQDLGDDPDFPQAPDAMLGGLGFLLAGGFDIRQQRHMDIQRIILAQFPTQLPDGFQKRQAFNVADRAADLNNGHIHVSGFGDLLDALFDLIGNMRDDLHGLAQIIPAALLGDHGIIDLAGGNAAVFGKLGIGETLIMAQVQVGFRPVIGDIHFPVLIGIHGAGIHV